MILCVDRSALKESPEVQRDIDIEDILNNYTKFFDSAEDADTENYAPLNFSVCIRSTYTNLVLEKDEAVDGTKKYYTNLVVEQPFNHKGYDLLMFLTSIGVMNNIFYELGFDDLMMNHSQFQPIGLFNLGDILDPVIITHVILSDEGAEEFSKFLMPDRRFVSISDMNTTGNLRALTDTLIEIKEEENNANSDNN